MVDRDEWNAAVPDDATSPLPQDATLSPSGGSPMRQGKRSKATPLRAASLGFKDETGQKVDALLDATAERTSRELHEVHVPSN